MGKAETWTYEYDECGGYDCMTGAFTILLNNRVVAIIDQRNFRQEHCNYERLPEAEAIAKRIVEAMNG